MAPEHWWDEVPEGRRAQIRDCLNEGGVLFEADRNLLIELLDRLERMPERKGPDGFWLECVRCESRFLTTDAKRSECGRCVDD